MLPSGRQDGKMSSHFLPSLSLSLAVGQRRLVPSLATRHISPTPLRMDMNARVRPSGLHTGNLSTAGWLEALMVFAPSGVMMKISMLPFHE